jgi:DNA polymerase III sliding clamp (beta) subunit (PCNA family)
MLLSTLQTALKFCKPAMAIKDVRYYLNGIAIKPCAHGIEFLSADGHRAHRITAVESGLPIPGTVILPVAFVDTLIKIKPASRSFDPDVAIVCSQSVEQGRIDLISVSCEGSTYTGQLIDGDYPDLDRVTPDDSTADGEIAINGQLLADSAAALAKLAGKYGIIFRGKGKNQPIKMVATPINSWLINAVAIVMPMKL